MQDLGLFLSIAEIAGVFVGFGALISLLRDQQDEGRVAVHAVIANGLVALVAALIPVALSQYGLTDRSLWGWSSGAFLLLCWAAIWGGSAILKSATRPRLTPRLIRCSQSGFGLSLKLRSNFLWF